MWGRLDAAGTADLYHPARIPRTRGRRVALIDEAQRAIIREELSDFERSRLYDQIAAGGAVRILAFARKDSAWMKRRR